jgi:hypothetical protein
LNEWWLLVTDDEFSIPVTDGQREALLETRPSAWEYLLFAGVLLRGRDALEPKYLDNDMNITHGQVVPIAAADAMPRLSGLISELSTITERVTTTVFEPAAQEAAFGAPGEPGDPVRIEHFASHIVRSYEDMLNWAARARQVQAEAPFTRAFQLVASMADQPISEICEFVDSVVGEIEELPGYLAQPEPEPRKITLSLVLTADQAILDEFSAELKRIESAVG